MNEGSHIPGGGQVEVGAAEGRQDRHSLAAAALRLDELLRRLRRHPPRADADVDAVLLAADATAVVQLRFLEGD